MNGKIIFDFLGKRLCSKYKKQHAQRAALTDSGGYGDGIRFFTIYQQSRIYGSRNIFNHDKREGGSSMWCATDKRKWCEMESKDFLKPICMMANG